MENNYNMLNGKKLSKQKIVNILCKDYRKCIDLLNKGVSVDFIWNIKHNIPKKVFNAILESEYVEALTKYEDYLFMYLDNKDDIRYTKYFLKIIKIPHMDNNLSIMYDIVWKKSEIISNLDKENLKLVLDLINTPEDLYNFFKNNKLSMRMEEIIDYINLPEKILNNHRIYDEENDKLVSILYKLGDYLKYYHIYIKDFSPIKMYLDTYFKIYDSLENENDKYIMKKNYLNNALFYICEELPKMKLSKHDLDDLLKYKLLLNDSIFQSLGKNYVCDYLYTNFMSHRDYIKGCISNGDVDSVVEITRCDLASVLCEHGDIMLAIENVIRISGLMGLSDVNIIVAEKVIRDLLDLDVCVYSPEVTKVYVDYIQNLDKSDRNITFNFNENILSRDTDLIKYMSESQILDYLNRIFFALVTRFGAPNISDEIVIDKVIILMLSKLPNDKLNELMKKNKRLIILKNERKSISDYDKTKNIIDNYYKEDIISKKLRDYLLYASKVTLEHVNNPYIEKDCELDIEYYKEFMMNRFKIAVYTPNTSSINLEDIYED